MGIPVTYGWAQNGRNAIVPQGNSRLEKTRNCAAGARRFPFRVEAMLMINRRHILCAAAAGAALLARIPNARAAAYDLVIKGGRVIDPSTGLDGVRDVAMAGGRIAAVESNITGDATETIDAAGKIVPPV